jgi:hypothetical protein
MTPEAVRELIEKEIGGDWSLSNLHGCDLKRCLVPPELREYDDCGFGRPFADPPPAIRLWLVLEEVPEERNGYKIVYDEESGMFGLAVPPVPGKCRDVFIGFYGDFLETYRNM